MSDIYKRAAKSSLRFESAKGQLTVEDLFALQLSDLDRLAKSVNKQLQTEGEESFLSTTTTSRATTENRLRLEILKDVIETKEAAATASANRAAKEAKIAQIKALVNEKENEAMANQSVKALMKQLAALEAEAVEV